MSESTRSRRSQAWFPGKYVPISHIHGAEIFTKPRGGVRVDRTTIHGTGAELRHFARQLLAAAARVDPLAPPTADDAESVEAESPVAA